MTVDYQFPPKTRGIHTSIAVDALGYLAMTALFFISFRKNHFVVDFLRITRPPSTKTAPYGLPWSTKIPCKINLNGSQRMKIEKRKGGFTKEHS